MTNQDFLNIILDDKKVQYDENLLNNVLYNYFMLSIQDVETDIDFNYMLSYAEFNETEYPILLGDFTSIKYVKSVIFNDIELVRVDVDEIFRGKPGYPSAFSTLHSSILNNNQNKLAIVFDKTPTTPFIARVVFYRFTFNDTTLTDKTASHPLLSVAKDLLYFKLASYIDRYYNDLTNLQADLSMYERALQKARALQHHKSGRFEKLIVKGLDRL